MGLGIKQRRRRASRAHLYVRIEGLPVPLLEQAEGQLLAFDAAAQFIVAGLPIRYRVPPGLAEVRAPREFKTRTMDAARFSAAFLSKPIPDTVLATS